MSFKPIQKLMVTRMLSSGEQVAVGVLAQNRQGIRKTTVSAIVKTLDQRKQENAALFQ